MCKHLHIGAHAIVETDVQHVQSLQAEHQLGQSNAQDNEKFSSILVHLAGRDISLWSRPVPRKKLKKTCDHQLLSKSSPAANSLSLYLSILYSRFNFQFWQSDKGIEDRNRRILSTSLRSRCSPLSVSFSSSSGGTARVEMLALSVCLPKVKFSERISSACCRCSPLRFLPAVLRRVLESASSALRDRKLESARSSLWHLILHSLLALHGSLLFAPGTITHSISAAIVATPGMHRTTVTLACLANRLSISIRYK